MPSYVAGRPRTGRYLTDEEIVRRYADGLDSYTLGLQAGCSCATVLQIVRAAGGAVRAKGASPRRPLKISDDAIVELYQSGFSGVAVGDRAGCTAGTIYNILRAAGVSIRTPTEVSKVARDAAQRARQSERGKKSAAARAARAAATATAAP